MEKLWKASYLSNELEGHAMVFWKALKKNQLSWHFSAWTQPMSKCLDVLGLFGHHGMNSRHFRAESNFRQKQVKDGEGKSDMKKSWKEKQPVKK